MSWWKNWWGTLDKSLERGADSGLWGLANRNWTWKFIAFWTILWFVLGYGARWHWVG